MNISEISRETGLPYSTTRKYLVLLEKSGFITSKMVDGAREYPTDSDKYVTRIVQLRNIGYTLDETIEKIKSGDKDSTIKIQYLEKEIIDLKREIYNLSSLLQNTLRQLESPPKKDEPIEISPKHGFFHHMKQAFKSLLPGNKKSGD
jgi:DNA-binding transcriptional MerR regulator